jgi:single-stranded DNA-binding protein
MAFSDSVSIFTNARVIRDPESRALPDGKVLVSVTIADNPPGGRTQTKYKPGFIEITFNGARAESVLANVKKGTVLASVRGRVFRSEYNGKIYEKMPYPEVIVFANGKSADEDIGEEAAPAPAKKPAARKSTTTTTADPFAEFE